MTHRTAPRMASALAAVVASLALAGCADGQFASGSAAVYGAGSRAVGPPQLEPASLVGQKGHQLETRLGPPDYLREEASARVWQYRLEGCVVDFVLYRNGSGLDVAAWNGRNRVSGLDYDHEACAHALARRGGQEG